MRSMKMVGGVAQRGRWARLLNRNESDIDRAVATASSRIPRFGADLARNPDLH